MDKDSLSETRPTHKSYPKEVPRTLPWCVVGAAVPPPHKGRTWLTVTNPSVGEGGRFGDGLCGVHGDFLPRCHLPAHGMDN